MGHLEIRRAVAIGHYFDDEETLRAYSYDASGLEERPLCVVKPTDEEELRRVLVAANQNRLAIVARGSGTGIRGGAIKRDAVIVDMRRFDAIERIDAQKGEVVVGAGCTFAKLDLALARHNLQFPLVPENQLATIGALIVQNHLTEESALFGDYTRLALSIEQFDGVARHGTDKDASVAKIVGWEGSTGIITKVKLRVFPRSYKRTLNLSSVKDIDEALTKVAALKQEKGVLLLEYLDAATSVLVGLDETPHLIVGYANEKGQYKDAHKIEELLTRRKGIERELLRQGLLLEDAHVGREHMGAFEALCKKEGLVCYGHLGSDVLMTAVKDAAQRERFWNGTVALGGIPQGKHGYGRLKKGYVPAAVRKQAIMLKEERDYKNTLNPGVIL